MGNFSEWETECRVLFLKEIKWYSPITQGFSFPGPALQGSMYSSNISWFCSRRSSRSRERCFNDYYNMEVLNKKIKLANTHTRWAVIKVEISTKHIKNNHFVWPSVGGLKLVNPHCDHSQLLTANLPFACLQWEDNKIDQLSNKQNRPVHCCPFKWIVIVLRIVKTEEKT